MLNDCNSKEASTCISMGDPVKRSETKDVDKSEDISGSHSFSTAPPPLLYSTDFPSFQHAPSPPTQTSQDIVLYEKKTDKKPRLKRSSRHERDHRGDKRSRRSHSSSESDSTTERRRRSRRSYRSRSPSRHRSRKDDQSREHMPEKRDKSRHTRTVQRYSSSQKNHLWEIPEDLKEIVYFDTRPDDQLVLFERSLQTNSKRLHRYHGGGRILGLKENYRISDYKNNPVEIILEPITVKIDRYMDIRWKSVDKETQPFQPKRASEMYNKDESESDECGFIRVHDCDNEFSCGSDNKGVKASEYQMDDSGLGTYIQDKLADFGRHLDENPGDVNMWLEYIDFQDTVYKSGQSGNSKGPINEIKMSMYEKALGYEDISNNARFLKAYLNHCEKTLSTPELLSKWDEIFDELEEDNMNLLLQRLDVYQTAFGAFDVWRMIDIYIETMDKLRPGCGKGVTVCYKKMAVSIYQALLELTFFQRPPNDSKGLQRFTKNSFLFDQTLREFESFWESEYLRIGDGGKGWLSETSVYHNQEKESDSSPGLDPEDKSIEGWYTDEIRIERSEISKDRKDQNPFSTILFSDIEPFLFPVSADSENASILIWLFITFMGVRPPFPLGASNSPFKRLADGRDMVNDPMRTSTPINMELPNVPDSHHLINVSFWPQSRNKGSHNKTSKESYPFELIDGILTEPLNRSLLDTAPFGNWHIYSTPSACFFDNMSPILDGESDSKYSEALSICFSSVVIDPDMLANNIDTHIKTMNSVLEVLSFLDNLPDHTRWYVQLVWMAVEGALSRSQGKKVAKRLLKRFPNDIILWNAFATLEFAHKNYDEACRICRTAISVITSEDENNKLVPILWKSLVWFELRRGQREKALATLTACANSSSLNGIIDMNKASQKDLDKARKYFAINGENFKAPEEDEELGRVEAYIAEITLAALFQYLDTSEVKFADMIFDKGLQNLEPSTSVHTSEKIREGLLLMQCSVHFYNNSCATLYQPKTLRSILTKVVDVYPDNIIFWQLFVWSENRMKIKNRVQLETTKNIKRNPTPQLWLFRIYMEMFQASEPLSNQKAIRKLFMDAVNDENVQNCPLIWALYVAFECKCKAKDKAKQAFYLGINRCVWNKDLLMLAFNLLADILNIDEKKEIIKLMIEKDIWINASPERIGL
ncbi:hypothetical protein H4219_001789 [Mycoemilia scoparia]|uniref:Uncharacterized protein n=1 Tax=Mycoemilia scoparia TaxID=417184 RepID=A0A9W8DVN0_9FUNG|nr:hypothetical protein H4219_001789 [Mycoemilia scoparia]